jgi:hypothetical protein
MAVAFIHLSDIHFGQEKGSAVIVHDDVKERLIEDAADLVKNQAGGQATGVIVTGDIAYGGKPAEYQIAADWLDRLTAAIGCAKTAVQVVPGNHDIDRDAISSGCRLMLEGIIADGEAKLDAFLANELDREVLYGRFAAYRPFAEGYNCSMDRSGGRASDRSFELVPGRTLRFIGLNSALICSANDQEGRLLLGTRQLVLPRAAGEELVVLCHHPLHWLQDSDEARRYVRSRARVFISGHEHDPSLNVENIKDGCDLMTLAAGATVPPKAEGRYTYTYNLLIFDWDADTNGLNVTIMPRAWSPENTEFDADDVRLGGHKPTVVLGCPNFRGANGISRAAAVPTVTPMVEKIEVGLLAEGKPADGYHGGEAMADPFPLLLLRFFRDLSPAQRLAVLVKLKALPDEWRDPLTHAIERPVVDALAKAGRLAELEAAINEIQAQSAGTSWKEP